MPTIFQGASVVLKPGASICTSSWYWFSTGMPKKPISQLLWDVGWQV